MTIDEIITLGKMGYSKEDIEKLSVPKKEEPKKEEAKKEEPKHDGIRISEEQLSKLLSLGKELPKEEPKEEPKENTSTTLSNEQFDILLQKLRTNGANIDVPKTPDIQEKLADHFKSLFGNNTNYDK